MADAILEVELTAKIDLLRDQFNKAIQESGKWDAATRKNLSAVDKGFVDLANSVDRSMSKAAKSTSTASNVISKNLANAANATAKAGQGVSVGANQAANALTNLGRVAQDAPFGFVGIQNNLNPLLESFQRLKAETGSTGSALKALGSSLIGPAGLGIALSVVSSAIVLYTQYQQKANKVTSDAKKNTDDYINSLDQLSQVQLKGAQNAQKELTELKTLYSVAQNVALSTKQRGEAVDELQKKYPEYFKSLKDETILNGNAKDAYDRLTTSIIATARARAAQDLITKNSSRQLENEQKLTDLETESNKLSLQAAKLRKDAEDEIGSTRDLLLNRAIGLEAKRIEIYKQQNNIKTDTSLLDQKNLKLTEAINDQIAKGADLVGNIGADPKDKASKTVQTLATVLKELQIELIQVDASFNTTFGEKAEDKIKAYQKAIDNLIKIGYDPATEAVQKLKKAQQDLFQLPQLKDNRSAVDPSLAPKNYLGNDKGIVFDRTTRVREILTEEQRKILEQTIQFNEEFEKIATSGITNALGGIGSAIGEALAEGGNVLAAVGNTILGTFSGFLDDFGDLLIKYGAAAVLKGKLDLAVAVPGAGIFAGAAAIAAGIALKVAAAAVGNFASGKNNKQEAPTAFANGGIVSGPTNALVGEYAGARNNPEVISPLDKLTGLMTASITQALAGSRSIGNITSMTGGAKETVFIAESITRGEDIVTVYRRTSARLNRQ